jgi:hypothetical protein
MSPLHGSWVAVWPAETQPGLIILIAGIILSWTTGASFRWCSQFTLMLFESGGNLRSVSLP